MPVRIWPRRPKITVHRLNIVRITGDAPLAGLIAVNFEECSPDEAGHVTAWAPLILVPLGPSESETCVTGSSILPNKAATDSKRVFVRKLNISVVYRAWYYRIRNRSM